MALLAPGGSTITLTPLASTLPLSGTTNIIAQVIEPAGTPPQRGTLVTFTTTIGTIQPIEAETDSGGRVMVTFNAGTLSGTATITALSGGVTTGDDGRHQDRDRSGGRRDDRVDGVAADDLARRQVDDYGDRQRRRRAPSSPGCP